MHSWWIKIPFLIVGFVIFARLGVFGLNIIIKSNYSKDKKAKWIGSICTAIALLGIPAYWLAWDEKRVVAAFAEWFVVLVFFYAIPIGSIAAGYFVWNKIYIKTARKWLAWIAGIVVALMIVLSLKEFSSKIPGVGWRLEKMSEDTEEYDYDH